MVIFLYVFWLILNQRITAEICIFGVFIVGAVFLFMRAALGYSLKKELALYRCALWGIVYLAVLVWEIIKANFTVASIVLFGGKSFVPAIVHVDIPLKSRLLRMIYANSITLTPGTITVDETDGRYTVHCLNRPMGQGLDDTRLLHILMKMEAKL